MFESCFVLWSVSVLSVCVSGSVRGSYNRLCFAALRHPALTVRVAVGRKLSVLATPYAHCVSLCVNLMFNVYVCEEACC